MTEEEKPSLLLQHKLVSNILVMYSASIVEDDDDDDDGYHYYYYYYYYSYKWGINKRPSKIVATQRQFTVKLQNEVPKIKFGKPDE